MIFYFSATGNSRWAAIRLHAATQEELVNIADYAAHLSAQHSLKPFLLKKGERIGFVFPVHGWRVPMLVRKFIQHLQITREEDANIATPPFCYAVCTAGDSIGRTIPHLNSLIAANSSLAHLGISHVVSAYSLIMPESYVGLPFMDVDSPHKEEKKKNTAANELADICKEVYDRKAGNKQLKLGFSPWFMTKVIGGFFEHVLITDKHFHVNADRCVKCGICSHVCPVDDIKGGKGFMPQWLHHDDCLTCFSCYHHCPHHAIEFGNQTQHKGQYYFK